MTSDDHSSRTGRSRRSLLRRGALASGALTLGLSGTAAGQAGGNETEGGNETAGDGQDDGGEVVGEALMFNDEYRPGAQFRVISGVVSETPELATGAGEIMGRRDAYIIEYLVTDERVLLFVSRGADVEQGQVYRLGESFGVVEEEATGEGIVAVSYQAVSEDDVIIDPDFSIDDVETVRGGGKALVRADNLFPGSLLRVVSGVVEWTPPPDVAGSDILSDYNTRHAVYLNTDDEFLVYPAHAAEIEEGAVYVIREEFDVTAPEANLVTVELDRVDAEQLDDDLLDG